MDFSFKIEGLAKIEHASGQIRQAVANEINKALFISAKKIEEDAKKSILDGKKTGRAYKRGAIGGRKIGTKVIFRNGRAIQGSSILANVKGFKFHRASAAGESPASDTGRLVNSINSSLSSIGGEAIVKAGSSAVKYAAWLEFGTLGVVGHSVSFAGGKASETGELRRGVAARPYLFPALEKNKQWINARLQEAIKIALTSSSF